MPGRTYSSSSYRYGFNGKENDNEVKGTGNQQDYGMRIYDPRIGKFLSEDPLTKDYPELTPYQFASNSPIENSDLDGAESLSEIKAGLAKKIEMQMRVMNFKQVDAQIKSQSFQAILRQPQLKPAPTLSPQEQKVHDAKRVQKLEASGYNADGSPRLLKRIEQSETAGKIWDKIVVPAMYLDGVYGLYRGRASLLGKQFLKTTAEETTSASTLAKSFQGSGQYPGVDAWRDINLKQGTFVVGGLPGQGNFYTTMNGLNRSGLSKEALWDGLQVKSLRPEVGIYEVTGNTSASFGTTYANSQFGAVGLPQIYIPDINKLKLLQRVPLH